MEDYVEPEYTPDESVTDMMWTDHDYHVNTGELIDWYPDKPNPDDFSDRN